MHPGHRISGWMCSSVIGDDLLFPVFCTQHFLCCTFTASWKLLAEARQCMTKLTIDTDNIAESVAAEALVDKTVTIYFHEELRASSMQAADLRQSPVPLPRKAFPLPRRGSFAKSTQPAQSAKPVYEPFARIHDVLLPKVTCFLPQAKLAGQPYVCAFVESGRGVYQDREVMTQSCIDSPQSVHECYVFEPSDRRHSPREGIDLWSAGKGCAEVCEVSWPRIADLRIKVVFQLGD
jgi:hypothetical protein